MVLILVPFWISPKSERELVEIWIQVGSQAGLK